MTAIEADSDVNDEDDEADNKDEDDEADDNVDDDVSMMVMMSITRSGTRAPEEDILSSELR